ncbi:MAG TPA: hypothetical protein VL463_30785 [Kofleriaceae bacterium]|nr:hypothetical protein [Kofleriaceae bacterium]
MPRAAWFSLEVAALAIVAIAPVPVPAAWLLAIASVSLWARGRSWIAPVPAPIELVPVGVACGAIALGIALALSSPIGALTGRMVEWTQYAIVRGSAQYFVVVAIIVGAQAIAIEMALRGWLIPRVLEVAPRGGVVAAALASALAEAIVTPGHLATRLGAFVLGLGGAVLFLGAGRRLAAPLACRLTFELGAVVLAALRLV